MAYVASRFDVPRSSARNVGVRAGTRRSGAGLRYGENLGRVEIGRAMAAHLGIKKSCWSDRPVRRRHGENAWHHRDDPDAHGPASLRDHAVTIAGGASIRLRMVGYGRGRHLKAHARGHERLQRDPKAKYHGNGQGKDSPKRTSDHRGNYIAKIWSLSSKTAQDHKSLKPLSPNIVQRTVKACEYLSRKSKCLVVVSS